MKKSTPTVTVGLDVGEQFIHLCEMDATSGVIETAKFRNGRHHVRKRFEGVERCRIVLEAGSHSRWLAEDLTEMGHEVLVVNPRKLKLVSDSLYKDDTLDAERLADQCGASRADRPEPEGRYISTIPDALTKGAANADLLVMLRLIWVNPYPTY